jgi:hypothetical protein
MGPGAGKWLQTDREVISYHYHSKLGEVLAVPWRRVFTKKNPGSILTCTIRVLKEEVYFEVLEKLPTFRSRARAAARGGRAPADAPLGCPDAVV